MDEIDEIGISPPNEDVEKQEEHTTPKPEPTPEEELPVTKTAVLNLANDPESGITTAEENEHEKNEPIEDTIFNKVRQYYIFPFVSIGLHAMQWGFFLWGLYHIKNDAIYAEPGESIYNRVSPPMQTYWFLTVNYWPSCTDARSNTWRLVSFQFTHNGFTHIVSNTLIGTIFSMLIEMTHPYAGVFILVVYEMGVIFGALAYSYLNPYLGLVGSSSGVYAIIGSIIPHLILDWNYRPYKNGTLNDISVMSLLILPYAVLLIMLEDIISYFVNYKNNTAYSAHFAGWIVGLFLGCAFSLLPPVHKKPLWKYVVGALGAAGFIGQFIFLIYNYRTNWPPEPYDTSCCGGLLELVEKDHTISFADARAQYTCPNGDLYGIIKKDNKNGQFLYI